MKTSSVATKRKRNSPKVKKISPKPNKRVSSLGIAVVKHLGINPQKFGDNPPKPELRLFEVVDLRIDENYQRGLKKAIIYRIASFFSYFKLGIPIVAIRNGVPYVIDGQQRITAIKFINSFIEGYMTSIWCEVIPHTDGSRDESEIFGGRNDRASMSAIDIFKADYNKRDARTVNIVNVLTSKGIRIKGIKTNGRTSGMLPITCVNPVRWAYDKGVLQDSIDVIKSTWGLVDNAFNTDVIHSISLVISKNQGRVNLPRLTATLSKFRPAGLQSQCGTTNGRVRCLNIANFIVDHYNKGAGKGRIDRIHPNDMK